MQSTPEGSTGVIIAAAIAASASVVATGFALLSAWWQRRAAQEKAEVDIQSLKMARDKIEVDIQSLRRLQRAQAYPKLWAVVQSNVSDWRIEGKEVNADWARAFLAQLNTCHAECGVFFTQPVYQKFCEFRAALIEIDRKAHNGHVSKEDLYSLDLLWSGYQESSGVVVHGLAFLLKEELDSYEPTAWPTTLRAHAK